MFSKNKINEKIKKNKSNNSLVLYSNTDILMMLYRLGDDYTMTTH